MAVPVTPRLVEHAYEAALKSFWRKKALHKFLRGCDVSETFLATWSVEESKRDYLDRLTERLQRKYGARGSGPVGKRKRLAILELSEILIPAATGGCT